MKIKTLPFIITLMVSMLMTITANSWFTAWIGLEINMMSMIPLFILSKGQETPEPAIKYFLVQALGSSSMMFVILLMKMQSFNNLTAIQLMLSSSLLLKSGVSPLHFWFPSVIEDSSWMACTLLMTVQKVAPITLLASTLPSTLVLMLAILSVMIGSLGGLNQTILKKVLAYSSISHLGWILMSLHLNNYLFMLYNLSYWILVLSIIFPLKEFNVNNSNQVINLNTSISMKVVFLFNFMSMGGLPPLMGFLPKLMVVQGMIQNGMLLLASLMIIMTLLTLFYYIKTVMTILINIYPFNKTVNVKASSSPMKNVLMILLMIPTIGLFPMASLLFYTF
nr:NADH dehydrogenase subunit 2 [Myrmecophilus kubotai]